MVYRVVFSRTVKNDLVWIVEEAMNEKSPELMCVSNVYKDEQLQLPSPRCLKPKTVDLM